MSPLDPPGAHPVREIITNCHPYSQGLGFHAAAGHHRLEH